MSTKNRGFLSDRPESKEHKKPPRMKKEGTRYAGKKGAGDRRRKLSD